MQNLGSLIGDYYNGASITTGINNLGQVAIAGLVPGLGYYHAFLYSNGVIQDLGTLPGGYSSSANGINDAGQVVGTSDTAIGQSHAFLYSNGVMQDLGTLSGYGNSFAFDINETGQVVGGSANVASYFNHPYLWSNGVMQDLGALEDNYYSDSYAVAINNAGQVVGNSTIRAASRAFLYSDGKMLNLGTLGGYESKAADINNLGQVVGNSWTAEGEFHAFLYSNGVMQDLSNLLPSDSGWQGVIPQGINDKGQVVGYGLFKGEDRAFLMTPALDQTSVPEPTSGLGLLAFGALGTSYHLLRKKTVA